MKFLPSQNRLTILHFLLFILSIEIISPFHWSGNTLYDLENSDLTSEVASWDLTLYRTPGYKVTYCSTEYILGGYCVLGGSGTSGSNRYYGQYFYKTYSSLPAHNQVNIKVKVYTIDSWDGTGTDDHFEIGIDNNSKYAFRMNGFDPVYSNSNLCGNGGFKDFPPFQTFLSYPHSANTLTFKMISCADEDSCNESLGFRNVIIEFVTAPLPYESICAISGAPISSNPCPCADPNMFMYPPNTGNCVYCHASCATCDAPTASDCTGCAPGKYLINGQCLSCNSNCLTCAGSATQCTSCNSGWFMVNGVCYSSCDPPLITETISGVTFCKSICATGQYLYWDGTCSITCTYPSNAVGAFGIYGSYVNTFLQCIYPCNTNQYLAWNGTCLGSCPSPLTTTAQFHSRNFCDYSCGSSQFLYWNGTCGDTCPSPLAQETQGITFPRKFCWYYCQPGEFLYWNGTCGSTCPLPLAQETQGTYLQRQFCWYYCQANQYLYWNETCGNTCPFPLAQETQGTYLPRKFCWYDCQPGEYLYWNGSCIADCPAPLAKEIQGTYLQRQFCWYYCQPNEYLYWNGSCLSQCPIPLTIEIQGSVGFKRNFCWYTCQPNEYLYWNQSCSSSCEFPLQPELQGTYLQRNFCWYLCPVTQHLYWNGSCMDNCPLPLTSALQGTFLPRYFCIYTCGESEFLYWNQSCSGQCPFPLANELQGIVLPRKFCWFPCMPWQWLKWDQTCQDSCVAPLAPETQGTNLPRQFCWYPCDSGFLYWNGTCLPACPKPLVSRYANGQWFCDYPCGSAQYLYWNGSCSGSCNKPLVIRTEGSPIQRMFCDYPCVGSQHLYWNGTCSSKCNAPLVVRLVEDKKFCDYLCPAGEILYWDGTCGMSCGAPLSLVSQGNPVRRYCEYQCGGTQFLYWNGSCGDACNFPLTSYVQKGRLFCNYTCTINEYLYSNGSCIGSCTTPFVSRVENGFRFCDYSCADETFLYWNGSCLDTCEYPLSQRVTNGNLYCDFPCTTGTDFLYWNGTCSSSCPSPLGARMEGTLIVRKFCSFKCGPGEYLYWNQTCSEKCDSPLTKTTSGDKSFCYYPCNPNQYLYWNGSCLSTCDFPLSQRVDTDQNKYCDYPCKYSSLYLYWNGSCIHDCTFPLSTRTEGGKPFCDHPCENPAAEYLYWNSSCSSECNSPFISKTEGNLLPRKYCSHPCHPSDYLFWNASCLSHCPFPLLTRTDGFQKSCHPPCSNSLQYYYPNLKACYDECHQPAIISSDEGYLSCSTLETSLLTGSYGDFWRNAPTEQNSVTIVNLVKNMQYVRYLDINMPPRLQRLSLSQGRNLFSLSSGIKMSDSMRRNFEKQHLSSVYARNRDLHSSFLVNYWEDLMTMMIAFMVGLGFLIFERLSRALDWKLGEIIGHTMTVLIKWNYVLIIFASSFDHIILFSGLEFKYFVPNTSAFANLSLTSSLMAIISMLALITWTCYSVLKKNMIMSQDSQVLFRGLKGNSRFSQLFFIIYMSRIAVTTLVSVCFEVSPMMISILEIIISACMIVFLVIKEPFVKRINQYQMIFFEVITLLMNVFMFVLTILSSSNENTSNKAIVLGDLVIIGNDIINVALVFFLVIKLHLEIKALRKFTKVNSLKGPETTGLWLQLLFIPMQLCHMGFEEMIVYDIKQGNLRFAMNIVSKPKPQLEVVENVFDVSFDQCDNIRQKTEDMPQNSERKNLRFDEEEEKNSFGGSEAQGQGQENCNIEVEVPKDQIRNRGMSFGKSNIEVLELNCDQIREEDMRRLRKNPSHSSLRVKSRFVQGAENNNVKTKSLKFSIEIEQKNVFNIQEEGEERKEALDASENPFLTNSLSLSSFQYDTRNFMKEGGFENVVMDNEDLGLSYSERRNYENEKMETVERVELRTEENNKSLNTLESSSTRQIRKWKKRENSIQMTSEEKPVEEPVRPQDKNETQEVNLWKGVQALFRPKSKGPRK